MSESSKINRRGFVKLAVGTGITLGVSQFGNVLGANDPTITDLTPGQGHDGQLGVVHGNGFTGQQVAISFGSTSANNITINSDQVIKFNVPTTTAADRLVSNPDQCTVTVNVGGVISNFVFTYVSPGQQPAISGFSPASVPSSSSFSTQVQGSNFTNTSGRIPSSTFLVNAPTNFNRFGLTGTVLNNPPPTSTAFNVAFRTNDSSLIPAGRYLIMVGFSDGSAASGEFSIF